ncbi:MAG: radical SAM protein [Candidatus Aenigmatarchaeota archaeon]
MIDMENKICKMRKKVRTISGVTILSLMTKPLPCPGRCIYCPGGLVNSLQTNGANSSQVNHDTNSHVVSQNGHDTNSKNSDEFSHDTNSLISSSYDTPKSYVAKSPTVLRACRYDYDSRKQIEARINALKAIGHIAEKNEVIVMGGTFISASREYRDFFIKGIYDGLNGFVSNTLEESQKANETAEQRCVALCIETRPDWCKQEHIDEMLRYGATRVEMGVQLVDDRSYELTKRGHCVKDVIEATKRLKDAGFKVYYHYMCNLPGSNTVHTTDFQSVGAACKRLQNDMQLKSFHIENDIKHYDKLFSDPDFRPDGLKIYPCQVVQGTELAKWVEQGKHRPYSDSELIELVARLKQITPRYARIQSIMRALPAECIVAGTKCSGLRMNAKEFMKANNMKCQCIRCREVGYRMLAGQKINLDAIKLNRIDYDASDGKEILLTLDDMDSDALIGLLRLRIPSKSSKFSNCAMVREIHVYGLQKGLVDNSNTNNSPVSHGANSSQANYNNINSKNPQLDAKGVNQHEFSHNTNSHFVSQNGHDRNSKASDGVSHDNIFQHLGYGRRLLQEAEKIATDMGFDKVVIISGVGVRRYYIDKCGYKMDGCYVSKNL